MDRLTVHNDNNEMVGNSRRGFYLFPVSYVVGNFVKVNQPFNITTQSMTTNTHTHKHTSIQLIAHYRS